MREAYTGQIILVSFDIIPDGWALCDGRLMLISYAQELFSVLGNRYGGDGTRTFALPDLRSRVPMGSLAYSRLGEVGGEESVALAQIELPAHSHQLSATSGDATQSNPTDLLNADSSTERYNYAFGELSVMNSTVVGGYGGGMPHENRMPFTAIQYLICIDGFYPFSSLP